MNAIVTNEQRRPPKDYRVNGADTARLAQQCKLAINSSLSIEALQGLGAERLLALLTKSSGPGSSTSTTLQANAFEYNMNDPQDDEGAALRAVGELKNAMQAANPGALARLGVDALQAWKKQVDRAVAGVSAKVARNSGAGGMQHNAGDEWAGYDLNATAAQ